MTSPAWTLTRSAPAADDLSGAERAAWRKAYRLADAHPGEPITVWSLRGDWYVLRKAETPPPRAKPQGTLVGPLNYTTRYSVHHPNGRVTFHEMKRGPS